jgi:hypothetical protein
VYHFNNKTNIRIKIINIFGKGDGIDNELLIQLSLSKPKSSQVLISKACLKDLSLTS